MSCNAVAAVASQRTLHVHTAGAGAVMRAGDVPRPSTGTLRFKLGARRALIEAGSLATAMAKYVKIAQEMRQSGGGDREGGRGLHTMPCHNNRLSFSVALLTSSTSNTERRKQRDVGVASISDTCDVLRDGCVLQLPKPPQLMPRAPRVVFLSSSAATLPF